MLKCARDTAVAAEDITTNAFSDQFGLFHVDWAQFNEDD